MHSLFEECGHGSLPRLPFHKNPGLEIVCLHRGHLVWQCEGKTEALKPGSVFFTLPWQEHGSVSEFEPGHEWSFVVIRLPGASPEKPGRFEFPSSLGFDQKTTSSLRQLLINAPLHTGNSTSLFRTLMHSLMEELKGRTTFHDPRVVRLTSLLILELASILSHPENQQGSKFSECISLLIAELEKSCAEPWTLEKMADRLGLKHTQFTELFHQYTGDSPLRYLNRLRIDKARRMLRFGSASITDIAFECGFGSSQHFAKVFRQFTNVTAQDYRKNKLPALNLPRAPLEQESMSLKFRRKRMQA